MDVRTAGLLPLPVAPDLVEPKSEDGKDLLRALKEITERYNKLYAVLRQDINTLMIPPKPSGQPSGFTKDDIGYGINLNALTNRYINPCVTTYKDGLVVADGADTNKKTATFNYLGVGDMVLGNGAATTLIADITSAGAGGLDTGAVAASTWYAIHVITSDVASPVQDKTCNPNVWRLETKQALMFSLSATVPTMPSGYNKFRRVGWTLTTADSILYSCIHVGDWWWWNAVTTAAPFLVLAITTNCPVTYTDVDCTGVAPSTARALKIGWYSLNASGASIASIRGNNQGTIAYGYGSAFGAAISGAGAHGQYEIPCDTSQVIEYRGAATTTAVSLCVSAYQDIV